MKIFIVFVFIIMMVCFSSLLLNISFVEAQKWKCNFTAGTVVPWMVTVGDGNGDGYDEIYYSSSPFSLYEIKKVDEWDISEIDTCTMTGRIVVGDVDNDEDDEVVFSCMDNHVYMLEEVGSWIRHDVGFFPNSFSVAIGDTDGNDDNELWIESNGTIYKLEWNGTGFSNVWSETIVGKCPAFDMEIGNTELPIVNEQVVVGTTCELWVLFWNGSDYNYILVDNKWNNLNIEIGDPDNDGDNAIYVLVRGSGREWDRGPLYEWKWNGTKYSNKLLTRIGKEEVWITWDFTIDDVNEDGKDEIYFLGAHPENIWSVDVYMIYYDNRWNFDRIFKNWERPSHGIDSGDADLDGDKELYIGSDMEGVYLLDFIPCKPDWYCYNKTHKGYKSKHCEWSNITYCGCGCSNGECIVGPNDWICLNETYKVFKDSNCQMKYTTYCEYGCGEGRCCNVDEIPFNGKCEKKIDLLTSISDITFSNSNPVENEEITVTTKIHNIGNIDVNNTKIEFLIDDFSIETKTINIPALSNKIVNFEWVAEKGTHEIKIILDPDDLIDEADETNNIAFKPIDVTELTPSSFPDLTLSPEDIEFSSDIKIGQPITVTATIHNIGEEDATNIMVEFFDNGRIDKIQTIDSIPSGETKTAQVEWTPNCDSINLLVKIDPDNLIQETDETNNYVYLITPIGERQRLLEKLNSYTYFDFYEKYYNYNDNAPGPDEKKRNICDLDNDDIWMCSIYPISVKFMSGPELTTGIDTNTWYEKRDPSNRKPLDFEFNLGDIIRDDEIKEFLKNAECYIDFSGMPAYAPIYWDEFDERAEILQKPEAWIYTPSTPEIYASGYAYIYYVSDIDDIDFTGIEQINVGVNKDLFSFKKEKSWDFWILKFDCSLTTSGKISGRVGIKLPSKGLIPDGIAPAGKINVDASGNVHLIVEDETFFDEPPELDTNIILEDSPYILVEGVIPTKNFGRRDYIRSPFDQNVVYRDLRKLEPVLRIKLDKVAVNIDGYLTLDLKGPISPITRDISEYIILFDGYETVLGHTIITTHSPVNLHVYDSMGRHVGFNYTNGIDQEIPYSNFTIINGTNSVILTSFIDKFVVVVNGTGEGSYDMILRKLTSLMDSNGTNVITYINFNLTDVLTKKNDVNYFYFNFDEIEDRIRREIDNETDVEIAIKKVVDSLDFDNDGVPDVLDSDFTFDKLHTSLFTENAVGRLNESILLKTRLLSLDEKLSNKNISFLVDEKIVGSNLTDDEGNATLKYVIPVDMDSDGHQLMMVFYGDEKYEESGVNASLIVRDEAPRVEIIYPEKFTRVNGIVNTTGKISDGNLDSIALKIDGVQVSDSLPYNWNTTEYHEGSHVIELGAVDESDNENNTAIIVEIDNTPPEALIRYDPYSDDLIVEGLDDDVNVSYEEICLKEITKKWWFYYSKICVKKGRLYNLTDRAGNKMLLKMDYDRKGSWFNGISKTDIRLISVEYHVGNKINEIRYNHNSAFYMTKKKREEIKRFWELVNIKHHDLIMTMYDVKKNETVIIERDGKKVLEGLHTVDILTDMNEGLKRRLDEVSNLNVK